MTQPEWLAPDPTPLPIITISEDVEPPPEIKPRLKTKLKHYKSAPLAFVDPDPVFALVAPAPVLLDDIKAPETLPRTRRGQNKNKVVENIVEPCVNIYPPPRMYATIPRKRKIDPNPFCVS